MRISISDLCMFTVAVVPSTSTISAGTSTMVVLLEWSLLLSAFSISRCRCCCCRCCCCFSDSLFRSIVGCFWIILEVVFFRLCSFYFDDVDFDVSVVVVLDLSFDS